MNFHTFPMFTCMKSRIFTRFGCLLVWNHEFSLVFNVLMYEAVKSTWIFDVYLYEIMNFHTFWMFNCMKSRIFTRFGCLLVCNHEFSQVSDVYLYEITKFTWIFDVYLYEITNFHTFWMFTCMKSWIFTRFQCFNVWSR